MPWIDRINELRGNTQRRCILDTLADDNDNIFMFQVKQYLNATETKTSRDVILWYSWCSDCIAYPFFSNIFNIHFQRILANPISQAHNSSETLKLRCIINGAAMTFTWFWKRGSPFIVRLLMKILKITNLCFKKVFFVRCFAEF